MTFKLTKNHLPCLSVYSMSFKNENHNLRFESSTDKLQLFNGDIIT